MELVALGLITAVLIAEGYRQTKPLRQARALKALYGQHSREVLSLDEQESPKRRAHKTIKREGYRVTRILAVFDADLDGDIEIQFVGRYRGDPAMGIADEATDTLYRCVLREEGTDYVTSERKPIPPLS